VVGWLLLGCVVVLASMVAFIAVGRAVENPRTDDAEVFANFIGMAPQVDGPIMQLPIRDNQYVKAGELLFVVDERPYRYALERALSEQAALEGQIEDRQRSINSQISSIHVAEANIASNSSNRDALNATISEAEANLADSRAALLRAEADRKYAADNLHRLEPLLDQQYVTVDQVEQARTLVETRSRAVEQATAQVTLGEAHVRTTRSHYQQSGAEVQQSEAQREQAANGVETLAPLTNQREERAAAIRTAQYNLNNCRVYAPFDGYITNLTTSVGEYVHTGTQVFTMIDSRVWWVVANFRETQLNHVTLGSPADLFLMSHENLPLRGIVESIGHGVTPDPSVAGIISPGLPAIERSLSWVHLAARYPVRIRIESPPSSLLRIGENAVAVVHPVNGPAR
jgi:multidrug efflux system membrane fusion protein